MHQPTHAHPAPAARDSGLPLPTGRSTAGGVAVHHRFEEQVARTPDAVAVRFGGRTLTYGVLNARANQLARQLRDNGVGAEQLVALHLERSFELVVGMLAVLKAGGAYVPLDPSYPAERVAFMLQDSATRVVLTHPGVTPGMSLGSARMVEVGLDSPQLLGRESSDLGLDVPPERLAYVLYTSGSTGRPKGVMVPHCALSNHMEWMQETFPLGPGDRVLQKTPSGFDASVWEFYAPLLAGAELVLAAPGGHQDLRYLARTLRDSDVTVIQLVPSLLDALLVGHAEELRACPRLRRVFCGGEVLRGGLARRLSAVSQAELVNLYGPTEACIDTLFWPVPRELHEEDVPLGVPVTGVQALVLGEDLLPVRAGEAGELCLGGVALARGYLGRADLTAGAFVPHPLVGTGGERLYRTGDRVRQRGDGVFEFLGRTDHQVKIRGNRVELGEVEAALEQQPGIRQAAVVVSHQGGDAEGRLAAFVTTESGDLDLVALRRRLSDFLPDAMLPETVVRLEELPRLPNGKVDRGALAALGSAPRAQDAALAPFSPMASQVMEAVREVLGVPTLGPGDNFFEHGGHSLKAMLVMDRLSMELDRDLPLEMIFDAPTLADFVQAVEREVAGGGKA